MVRNMFRLEHCVSATVPTNDWPRDQIFRCSNLYLKFVPVPTWKAMFFLGEWEEWRSSLFYACLKCLKMGMEMEASSINGTCPILLASEQGTTNCCPFSQPSCILCWCKIGNGWIILDLVLSFLVCLRAKILHFTRDDHGRWFRWWSELSMLG